jgi:hypothetical protein
MIKAMRNSILEELKVVNVVIKSISIFMMHYFPRGKKSSKCLFHDISMLQYIPVPICIWMPRNFQQSIHCLFIPAILISNTTVPVPMLVSSLKFFTKPVSFLKPSFTFRH